MAFLDPKKIPVPAQNNSDNDFVQNIVGNKTDFIDVPYSYGDNTILAHLNTGYYHIHGQSFVYPDKAVPVTLTSGAGVWDETGAITEIIPAAAANVADFDLHWINISDIDTNCHLTIDIFSGLGGAEVKIGSTKAWKSSNFIAEGAKRIQIPQQPAGTRISCRLSTSAATAVTCAVSFEGHYYA